MSFFRVDDAFHRNPKRLTVSTAAVGLWTCMGSWSKDNKTAGFIPKVALRQLAPDLTEESALELADELVNARVDGIHDNGYLLPLANGWQFHDWENYQSEDEKEAERRERISEVRRQAGLLGAKSRWAREWQNGQQHRLPLANDGNPGSTRVGVREDPISGSDPVSPLGEPDGSGSDSSAGSSQPKDLTGSARVSDGSSSESAGGSDEPGSSSQNERPSEFKSDNERAVFECWAATLWLKVHRHGQARPTARRLSHIRARLRDGFTVEDMRRVITRVAQSAFHLGENDTGKSYIEPKTIFRNRETVEEWLAKAFKSSGAPQPDSEAARRKAQSDEREKARIRAELASKRTASHPVDAKTAREAAEAVERELFRT